MQAWPGPQALLQVPQCLASTCRLGQLPPIDVEPVPHATKISTQLANGTQLPCLQPVPVGQPLPQVPQFLGSDWVEEHTLLQLVKPKAHVGGPKHVAFSHH
jgi:hypothetical protein